MSAQPPAGSAAAAAASSTVDDPIDVDVEDNAMEDDEAQEEEEEEEDEDVSMDAISDDGVDTEQPIDADLFRRLARDAAQLHTETAYDPEMEDEQDLDAGDLVDDVPIFTLVEQSDGQFDARGVLLTILDEADANVDDHEAMADVISSSLYDSDIPCVLFSLTLKDFRRIVDGYRVEDSVEQGEWASILTQHRKAEEDEAALEPADWAEEDPVDREDEEERSREGWLSWAVEQLEEGKRVSGVDLRWEDVRAYLGQFSKADACNIREYIEALKLHPNHAIIDWVRRELENGDAVVPQEHQHAYSLIVQLIIQMGDEQAEVFEEQLDKKDTLTHAIACLQKNLDAIIQHINPASEGASPSSAAAASSAPAAAAASSSSRAMIDSVSTVAVADLASERTRITEYLEGLEKRDAELEQQREARLQSAVALEEDENTPADDLAQEVHVRRTFLYEAHQRVLQILDGEDIPVTAGTVWADLLRTTAVDLEQLFSYHQVIPAAAFERLVREIGQDYKNDLEYEPEAFRILQEATENFLTRRFDVAGAQVEAVAGLTATTQQEREAIFHDAPLTNLPPLPVNAESLYSSITLEGRPKPPKQVMMFGRPVTLGGPPAASSSAAATASSSK